MTRLADTPKISPQSDAKAKAYPARAAVSVYRNTYDTRGITAALESVIRRVRSGRFGLRRQTLRARRLAINNKKAYRKFKSRHLLAFTTAGVFSKRNRKGLVSHSGFLVLDYDDLEAHDLGHMKTLAKGVPHTAALFVSPSGSGIKVLVAVEPKPADAVSHTTAWRAAAACYDYLLSGAADSCGKDLPRLTLLAHDPSAYLAREVTPLEWTVSSQSTQREPQTSRNGTTRAARYKRKRQPSTDDLVLTEALRCVPPEDYETWLLVGMAIHHDGGELSLWEEWSRSAPSKYEAGACERKWRTFNTGGGITLGTVYDLAKRNGWKGRTPRKRKARN